MNHQIEKFASILCFGFASKEHKEGDLCNEISSCDLLAYDQIFDALQILDLKHQESFIRAVIRMFQNNETLKSKEKFMRFVLSRCMQLSERPTLFSFLVVCTFINDVIFSIFRNTECFTVAKVASKCLISVFHRQYVDLFDKENGFEGFESYCEKLNVTVLETSAGYSDTESENSLSEESVNLEGFVPPDTYEAVRLLDGLEDIFDADFLLTDFEKKLLYERDSMPLNIDPSEDILLKLDDVCRLLIVEESVSDDSSESEDNNESLELAMQNLNIRQKYEERVTKRCSLCEDNCYKFVGQVAKQLEVCDL